VCGEGNDILDADARADSLYGEAGADTFRFSVQDQMTDTVYGLTPGVDHIHVATGRSINDVMASAVLTDGGSTIVDVGSGTLVVISSVTGINADWFV
jgi:Ca2+-binding RTX toxin-like protein